MGVSFLSILFFAVSSIGASTNITNMTTEAESSLLAGDYFHAYRSYIYLESAKPLHFGKVALAGYLQAIFILAPEKLIIQECDRFSKGADKAAAIKSNYICGLHFTELKKPDIAAGYLSKIERSTKFFWPAQILLATGELIQNQLERVIDRLKISEVGNYSKLDLEDEFYLTRARTRIVQNRFGEAIGYLQSVNSTSPLYTEALDETVFVFFKTEKFESAQVLIDVIKTNYESLKPGARNLKVSSATYFKIRYLEAYMALVQQRTEGALTLFSELESDFSRFLNRTKQGLDPVGTSQTLQGLNMSLVDSEQIQLMSSWIEPEVKLDIDHNIQMNIALSKEGDRVKSYRGQFTTELESYPRTVERLKYLNGPKLSKAYSAGLKKVSQNINTLALKADLGKLEITWMGRAQGARSLDEIIDEYTAKVRTINELMPP